MSDSVQSKLPMGLKCPFTVVIDTREQRPFNFTGIQADAREGGKSIAVSTDRHALQVGDYSLCGFESQVAVERKSLADLFATFGRRRKPFERALRRMADMELGAVVCEADWYAILTAQPTWSRLAPKTVFRSVIAWQLRYPHVAWWFCPGREFAERATFRILEMFWRQRILPMDREWKPEKDQRRSCS